jgi:hypothetical protein
VKYGERAPRGGRLDERQLRALVPRAAVPLVRCVVGARVSVIGNPRPIRKDVTAEAGVEIRLLQHERVCVPRGCVREDMRGSCMRRDYETREMWTWSVQ